MPNNCIYSAHTQLIANVVCTTFICCFEYSSGSIYEALQSLERTTSAWNERKKGRIHRVRLKSRSALDTLFSNLEDLCTRLYTRCNSTTEKNICQRERKKIACMCVCKRKKRLLDLFVFIVFEIIYTCVKINTCEKES